MQCVWEQRIGIDVEGTGESCASASHHAWLAARKSRNLEESVCEACDAEKRTLLTTIHVSRSIFLLESYGRSRTSMALICRAIESTPSRQRPFMACQAGTQHGGPCTSSFPKLSEAGGSCCCEQADGVGGSTLQESRRQLRQEKIRGTMKNQAKSCSCPCGDDGEIT